MGRARSVEVRSLPSETGRGVTGREGTRAQTQMSRRADPSGEGRTYYHAELPRGPFRRLVRLPYAVAGEPRLEVTHGVVRVRLTKPVKAQPAKA